MTFEERAALLVERMGMTTRQARFLTLVALMSGYCMRRQYAAFARVQNGKNPAAFLDRLVTRGLARRTEPRWGRGYLYHVKARAIYEPLDLADNRNRRSTSPPRQARRLMLLDYAIAQPTATWFATESEKVELFTHDFRVPPKHLPQHVYRGADHTTTTRRFVAKFPIFRLPSDHTPYLVTLALETTGRSVAQFLRQHAALLYELPAWHLVIVCPNGFARIGARAWRAAFRTYQLDEPVRLDPATAQQLHGYFRVRHALETGQAQGVTIDRKHEERRRRFCDTPYDALYPFWCREGGHLRAETEPPNFDRWQPNAQFSIFELPHSYDLFGRYPGVV
jgi:hypothetical protein